MKALRKRPGEPAEVIEVENTLKALQREVGGYNIETFPFADNATILCDEEGRIKGKPFNCRVLGASIVGTILVVGTDFEEFCDVPDVAMRLLGLKEKAPTGAGTPDVGTDLND